MGGICYLCKSKMGLLEGITKKHHYEFDQIPPKDMTDDDKMCRKCYAKDHGAHEEQEQEIASMKENTSQSSKNSPISDDDTSVTENEIGEHSEDSRPFTISKEGFKIYEKTPEEIERIEKMKKEMKDNTSSSAALTRITDQRHNEFKRNWQKGRVVQFKNDKIAILMRAHASQVQFIVAFDQVTREGFRLMAIDEGKEASAGGFTGGVSSYYYFQQMDFVR